MPNTTWNPLHPVARDRVRGLVLVLLPWMSCTVFGQDRTSTIHLSESRVGVAPSSSADWMRLHPSPTRTALEALVSPDYNGTALNQILRKLGDEFRLPVHLDVTELDALGIAVDTPITLQLPEIPLRQALRYMLKPLGLSYRIDGDVLSISSAKQINAQPTFFVYDLRPLANDRLSGPALGKVVEEAIRTIEPTEWFDGTWRIHSTDQMLVVCCSEMAHGQINLLLAQLRRQLHASDSAADSSRPRQAKPDPFGGPTGAADPFGSPK